MKFKNSKPIFLALAIVFTIIFYWYELKPAQIRRECQKKVSDEGWALTSQFERDKLGSDMNKINAMEREKGIFWYNDCLHSKGLKE